MRAGRVVLDGPPRSVRGGLGGDAGVDHLEPPLAAVSGHDSASGPLPRRRRLSRRSIAPERPTASAPPIAPEPPTRWLERRPSGSRPAPRVSSRSGHNGLGDRAVRPIRAATCGTTICGDRRFPDANSCLPLMVQSPATGRRSSSRPLRFPRTRSSASCPSSSRTRTCWRSHGHPQARDLARTRPKRRSRPAITVRPSIEPSGRSQGPTSRWRGSCFAAVPPARSSMRRGRWRPA